MNVLKAPDFAIVSVTPYHRTVEDVVHCVKSLLKICLTHKHGKKKKKEEREEIKIHVNLFICF